MQQTELNEMSILYNRKHNDDHGRMAHGHWLIYDRVDGDESMTGAERRYLLAGISTSVDSTIRSPRVTASRQSRLWQCQQNSNSANQQFKKKLFEELLISRRVAINLALVYYLTAKNKNSCFAIS